MCQKWQIWGSLHQSCWTSEFRMALVIIYAVLSHFDFVAKFTVKNLNKDFTNTGRGGGVTILWKFFIKPYYFLKDGFPYMVIFKFWGSMWRVKTNSKFENSFFPVLIYWNDNRIHLGFSNSGFSPPPTFRELLPKKKMFKIKELAKLSTNK